MSNLISAITKHDHAAIETALLSEPASASEKVGGWLPIQWAEKTGNIITFIRTARLTSYHLVKPSPTCVLKKYITLISSTDYEPIPIEQAAAMIWAIIFEGAEFKIDRWQRPLISSPEQILDIKYLLSEAGISSKQQLFSEVQNA